MTVIIREATDADLPAQMRRAWRRKGLALALKLRGLLLARERGIREIWTGNATTNAPMLALNERLGFRPRPAYIQYKWGGV